MFQKLDTLLARFKELGEQLGLPEVIANKDEFRQLSKEYAQSSEIAAVYEKYQHIENEIDDNRTLIEESNEDPELRKMAEEDIRDLNEKKKKIEEELKVLLIPKDPNDDKNIILEIRAGTGGEEASLFAGDLFRMYAKYAEKKRWRVEIMNKTEGEKGGFKEIVAEIYGKGAYSKLKYESGTHRVQRVPETEASGRVHTSAATVAILPEMEDVEVKIDQTDLRIDVFRASGHGGQSVNTTDSAVRLTHIPTGIVISMQDEKSQHKNKEKAMKILRAKLYEKYQYEQNQVRAEDRRNQVGSGDRSERIRTYNFPQGRMTDHRIGLTMYKLNEIIDGELDEVNEKLHIAFQTEELKAVSM